MTILHKLCGFQVPTDDLLNIYVLYIRSMLELNCQVWHHSLTDEDTNTLERVQKVALRIILKDEYHSYENALDLTNLKTLAERRSDLCLRFAVRCTKHPSMSKMFPLNMPSSHNLRSTEKYVVQSARTDRLKNSAIPQLQRALNEAS